MADTHYRWNLDEIVSLADFDVLLSTIEDDIKTYQKWYTKLDSSMGEDDFKAYLRFSETARDHMSRAFSRPSLAEALDESDDQAKLLKVRVRDLSLVAAEATRPVSNWFKGIDAEGKPGLDDAGAKRLFASVPNMEYALHYGRSAARYTLPSEQETIIQNKEANGIAPLVDLRDVICAEQTFTLMQGDGKAVEYETEEELRALVTDTDATVREAAYRALLSVYEHNAQKYFMVYQAIVKDWGYDAKLRGYKSPIAMRNFANNVPDRAIEVLMEVCEHNIGLFQDFFRYKASALGVSKLRRFDLYAPLKSSEKTYSLQESIDEVLTTLSEFNPRFREYAERIINNNHVDSMPAKHKGSGAFCSTISPTIDPYVLLNFTGKARDVSTIAHEFGHAIHSMYAAHLPGSVQHPTLPLAETASTFSEMILFDKILAATTDRDEKQVLLAEKLSDSYASIIRQNYFVKAELTYHEQMAKGLTPTDVGQIWLDTLNAQFGDSVEVDPIFAFEWAYIPHIVHTPFYCYSYNFGELLSLALYHRYKQEGQSFVPTIERILASGGSAEPTKLLRDIGIDIESVEFWQSSFAILADYMAQLKTLAT